VITKLTLNQSQAALSGPRIIPERLDPYPDEIFRKLTFWSGTNPDGKWPNFENSQSRHPGEIDDRLMKQALVQAKSVWCSGGYSAHRLVGVIALRSLNPASG
jgi:hypothetical protein